MRNYESEAAALRGLKPSAKVLALVLAARMNDRNDDWPGRPVCWPGLDTLAEDTDLKERAVRYAIDELVEAKVIRVYKERKPGTRWCHNVYEWTAPLSPNYHPDWMKRPDTQKEAVGARLSEEGWEYCEQNQIGPLAVAAEHPGFILPAEQPTLIDVTPPEDDGQLPINTGGPVTKPRKKITKAARKTTIPEDWTPNEKCLTYAHEHYPSMPVSIEVEKFRDYHLAKGGKYSNWDAAWRSWCRNGNGFANGAWAQQPALTQGAQIAQQASNSSEPTEDDFGYACLDMGIDPNLYINYWKPYMGLPSDPGWPEWAAKIDRFCGRS
jgi:hypothetical protein